MYGTDLEGSKNDVSLLVWIAFEFCFRSLSTIDILQLTALSAQLVFKGLPSQWFLVKLHKQAFFFLAKTQASIENCLCKCLGRDCLRKYYADYALRKIRRLSPLYSTSSLWCIIIRALLTCHSS